MDDHAPLLEHAFTLAPQEQSYVIDDIEGELPSFIHGNYYLNGPARFTQGHLHYRHWLDGDGMVCTLRFEKGQVRFANRYVRSHKFTAEAEAGRPLFRAFGTGFEGDRMKRGIALESPINVSAYTYGDTLLAFGEQGLPWELDPVTLETRGVYTFGGRLNEVSPFSAHPKRDPRTGEMFNFGIAFSARNPQLHIYRFAANGQLDYRKRLRIDYPCSIHDCTLSPSYVVLYLSPYLLDMAAMLEEGKTLMDALHWAPEHGSQLCLISRESGEAVARVPIGDRYCLHLINAFESHQQLVIDVMEYEQPIYDMYHTIPDLFTDVREACPVRFRLDLSQPTQVERQELAPQLFPDFPALDTRSLTQPYNDFWMLSMEAPKAPGRKFFNQLLHLAWHDDAGDVYRAPQMCYLGGEPVFIGHPETSTTGVILCQVFNAERMRGAFALFDAFHVNRGPIAVLRLREPIPLLFHACFQRR